LSQKKTIVLTFLDFPNPDKVHWSSTIDNFFMSFVNFYPFHILLVSKGIDYLLKLHANNLCKPTPPSADVDGDLIVNGDIKKPTYAKDVDVWEEHCEHARGLIGQTVYQAYKYTLNLKMIL
jgi:hypothetical protein